MENLGDLKQKIELKFLPVSLEPGIFGLVRPVLLWPQAISERMEESHLEAILAHEVWHVRRRDNLTAVIHMAAEAIFWFHPVVWWLEARLIQERERACDEEVLTLFNQPQIYAESILKVCEFCVESPLSCVSGVAGGDLKKRVQQIMSRGTACKVGVVGKCLLVAGAVMTVAVPVVFGRVIGMHSMSDLPAFNGAGLAVPPPRAGTAMAVAASAQFAQAAPNQSEPNPTSKPLPNPAPPKPSAVAPAAIAQSLSDPQWQTAAGGSMSFEVASVRPSLPDARPRNNLDLSPMDTFKSPGGLFSTNASIIEYLIFAYKIRDLSQLNSLGAQLPKWAQYPNMFDIEARAEGNPTKDQFRLMLQSLLADRFKLKIHRETQETSCYALVLAKNGPKNMTKQPDEAVTKMTWSGANHVQYTANSIANFTFFLSNEERCPVSDKTGLAGRYDFGLYFGRDMSVVRPPDGRFGSHDLCGTSTTARVEIAACESHN
jgi:uncharacterized protein (TIGR03435 family)